MKDLVTYIAKSIVDHPDQVEVNEVEGERTVVYELRVAPEDMGEGYRQEGPCYSLSEGSCPSSSGKRR